MIELRPWSENDFALLERSNTVEQKEHVGGPETHEKLLLRQKRYVETAEVGKLRMFVILSEGEPAGYIGYWERPWRGDLVYETGWGVFPEYQGRGIASQATEAIIALLKKEGRHRFLHAYPSVENAPSNALCKKLGFVLVEECDFEYPPGRFMKSNDWRFDLLDQG